MVILLSNLPPEKNVNVAHRIGDMTSGIADLTQPAIPMTGLRPKHCLVCFRDANRLVHGCITRRAKPPPLQPYNLKGAYQDSVREMRQQSVRCKPAVYDTDRGIRTNDSHDYTFSIPKPATTSQTLL